MKNSEDYCCTLLVFSHKRFIVIFLNDFPGLYITFIYSFQIKHGLHTKEIQLKLLNVIIGNVISCLLWSGFIGPIY
jgi:hypothetical protein